MLLVIICGCSSLMMSVDLDNVCRASVTNPALRALTSPAVIIPTWPSSHCVKKILDQLKEVC